MTALIVLATGLALSLWIWVRWPALRRAAAPASAPMALQGIRRVGDDDYEITLVDGRVFRGDCTIWHRYPSGDFANIHESLWLCARWQAHRWVEKDAWRNPGEPLLKVHIRTRQDRIAEWVQLVFAGDSVATAGPERTFRFVEEAIELAQAVGVPPEGLKRLVDYVYERPKGTPEQEVGGCFVTLYAACEALGIKGDVEADKEIARIQDPAVMERVRGRQAEKRKLLERQVSIADVVSEGLTEFRREDAKLRENRPSPRLCKEHGGMGFTADCIECKKCDGSCDGDDLGDCSHQLDAEYEKKKRKEEGTGT